MMKPYDRRHVLCASINSTHPSSLPTLIIHSSLLFLVSGHAQHGFNGAPLDSSPFPTGHLSAAGDDIGVAIWGHPMLSRHNHHLRSFLANARRLYSVDMASSSLSSQRHEILTALRQPGIRLDDPSIRECLLRFLHSGDMPTASALLRQVIIPHAPSVDQDGKMMGLWLVRALRLEEGGKAEVLATGLSMLQQSLLHQDAHLMIDSAKLILSQSLPHIIDLADTRLMDEWLHISKSKRSLHAALPAPADLEHIIMQVYVKRREWGRVAELIRQVGDASVAFYTQLYRSILTSHASHLCRNHPSSTFVTRPIDGHPGYPALRSVMQTFIQTGLPITPKAAEALEAIMLEFWAPPSFIRFLEGSSTIAESPAETKTAEPSAA